MMPRPISSVSLAMRMPSSSWLDDLFRRSVFSIRRVRWWKGEGGGGRGGRGEGGGGGGGRGGRIPGKSLKKGAV